jgi:hypothetical protein
MSLSIVPPSSTAAEALLDNPEALHRRLAAWNHRRLAVGKPGAGWRDGLRGDLRMQLLEGAMVERMREEVAARAAEAPEEPDRFVAWFEGLQETGPGQGDALFPWLAEAAGMAEMRWYLLQEVAGEAGFDDLVAYTQVKMPTQAKLELARNYWDEMGRGNEGGMHGPMLGALADRLELKPTIEGTVWPALALGNTLVAFATNRRYAYHAVGALGAVELTAPWRSAQVAAGLKRLGIGRERQYFALHATLDIRHSEAWNREVLRPLVAADPESARFIAEGALMRLLCGQRCFETYRARLWGSDGLQRPA